MISWSENLRTTDKLRNKTEKIKLRVEKKKLTGIGTFCICFAQNTDNLFDIYNMGELMFSHYRNSSNRIHIIGIAESRDKAKELAAALIDEVFKNTGGFDVRNYF